MSAPSIYEAVASSNTTLIKWMPSSTLIDGIDIRGYKIFRNNLEIDEVLDSKFIDSTVQPSTGYTYHVVAVSTSGELSPLSNEVELFTN